MTEDEKRTISNEEKLLTHKIECKKHEYPNTDMNLKQKQTHIFVSLSFSALAQTANIIPST